MIAKIPESGIIRGDVISVAKKGKGKGGKKGGCGK